MTGGKLKDINNILWDYNGTLLNDTHLCIDSINSLLRKRNLPGLDIDRYRQIFTFPVKKYYERAGFDFSVENFEAPAIEFINIYNNALPHIELFGEVTSVLEYFRIKKIDQYIISAMKQEDLWQSAAHQGIEEYFKEIRGINDHYANGKILTAKALVNSHGLKPENTCLIGDTLHDNEVGLSLGCEVILVANGHQSRERLEKSGRRVVNNLSGLKKLL